MTEEIISQTKLFVGGLNWKMRGRDLNQEFSKVWEVVFARVNLDADTKRSKGFGFVEFANAEDAAKAQKEMDWVEMRGREIKVDFAKENPEKMRSHEEAKVIQMNTEAEAEEDLDMAA